ncbi:hypothetical protein BDR22DRAFT_852076 [Usnea florida]
MLLFTILTVPTILFMCFQCRPIRGIWERNMNAHCVSPPVITKINQAYSVFSIIMDIICVFIPIMVFGNLQHNWRKKLAVFCLLGLGLCTAGAAAARAALYYFEGDDPTWGLIPEAICASVEQNVGIIVTCMPALRQFFTMSNKKCNAGHSASSEKPFAGEKPSAGEKPFTGENPFAGANPFITSPLSPPTDPRHSEQITPPDSASSSNITEKRHTQQTTGNEDYQSPTLSIASRLSRMSLIPASPTLSIASRLEKLQGAKDSQNEQTVRYKKKWEDRRGSRPTLGNSAVLGYSCEISSPKSST